MLAVSLYVTEFDFRRASSMKHPLAVQVDGEGPLRVPLEKRKNWLTGLPVSLMPDVVHAKQFSPEAVQTLVTSITTDNAWRYYYM